MEYAYAKTPSINGISRLWWDNFDHALSTYVGPRSQDRQVVRQLAREAIAREAEQAQAAAIKRQQEECK